MSDLFAIDKQVPATFLSEFDPAGGNKQGCYIAEARPVPLSDSLLSVNSSDFDICVQCRRRNVARFTIIDGNLDLFDDRPRVVFRLIGHIERDVLFGENAPFGHVGPIRFSIMCQPAGTYILDVVIRGPGILFPGSKAAEGSEEQSDEADSNPNDAESEDIRNGDEPYEIWTFYAPAVTWRIFLPPEQFPPREFQDAPIAS